MLKGVPYRNATVHWKKYINFFLSVNFATLHQTVTVNPFCLSRPQRSLKKKQKKSQGSSRFRSGAEVELTALPLLKGRTITKLADFKKVHRVITISYVPLMSGC